MATTRCWLSSLLENRGIHKHTRQCTIHDRWIAESSIPGQRGSNVMIPSSTITSRYGHTLRSCKMPMCHCAVASCKTVLYCIIMQYRYSEMEDWTDDWTDATSIWRDEVKADAASCMHPSKNTVRMAYHRVYTNVIKAQWDFDTRHLLALKGLIHGSFKAWACAWDHVLD